MIETIVQFFKQLKWQDYTTAVSLLFGIFTIIAYVEQRNSNKKNKDIMSFVEMNINKNVTEEEIKELKNRKVTMESQVLLEIPKLARMSVLKEQVQVYEKIISESYLKMKKALIELNEQSTTDFIDPEIEKSILDKIVPEYERKNKLEREQTQLTIFSVCMGIIAAFLPYPLNTIIIAVLSFPIIKSLIVIAGIQYPKEKIRSFIKYSLLIIFAITAVFILIIVFIVR